MENGENREKTENTEKYYRIFLILELSVIFIASLIFISLSNAQVGQNVTVRSNLSVGNSAPEVVNITIYQDLGSGIDLSVNSTREIVIEAIVRDYNGEDDLQNSTVYFYDSFSSYILDVDDNNKHYTNSSCNLDTSYGDIIEVNITCRLNIWYYAGNSTWNASVYAVDQSSLSGLGTRQTKVNTLLALGLPDEINYGLVNATNVSEEKQVNITNYGNVRINLSLEGYAVNRSDGWAMNCSLGALKNISIGYEKYNLTSSNMSDLNLTQFQSKYSNLTSAGVIKYYGLNQRDNDVINDAINSTYWRIYVPLGVAGTCNGNIIMGATRASGS